MDRIDMRVQVEPVGRTEMAEIELGEASGDIRERVVTARATSAARFAGESWTLNSEIPARELRNRYRPERSALNFLHDELDREQLTARGLHKVIRLAWTLADLTGHTTPTLDDVKRAYSLREGAEL